MKGKCVCGQVEFEISGNLPNLYQCHCSLCKKATGTAACLAVVVGVNNIKWLKGQDNITSFTKENGFRTDFCSTCGSPVPNKMNLGEYLWIPAGVLEGSMDGKIAAHIFSESMASWEDEAENCKSYQNAPEDVHAFMESLSNKN